MMVTNLISKYPKTFDVFIKKHLNVDNYSLMPLAGDASSRRYYRLIKGSSSWVLMEWEPFSDPQNFPFISVQQHFLENSILVPKILAFDQAQGLFLLEDLGDLTLERRVGEFLKEENIVPYYKVTLDHLIKIHQLYLDQKNLPHCTAYKIAFDVEKLNWELNYTLKNLFTILCPHSFDDHQMLALHEEFLNLAKELASAPQVLCHRDFHSRNIMIKADQIYFIDFQDARLGPAPYDLVSLVHDSYVRLSDQTISELIAYYLDNFPEVINLYQSKDNFMHIFNLQMLQRCFKACGTFAAIKNQRNDTRYLKYLPHTLTKVRQALTQLPQFPMISLLIKQLDLPQIEKWP